MIKRCCVILLAMAVMVGYIAGPVKVCATTTEQMLTNTGGISDEEKIVSGIIGLGVELLIYLIAPILSPVLLVILAVTYICALCLERGDFAAAGQRTTEIIQGMFS